MERYWNTFRKYLPQTALAAAVIWLFWQIYPIIFATHDDLRNYVLVRGGTLAEDAVRMAKDGRISHLWNHYLLAVPFLADSLPFYKLVQYAAFLFDLFAGWLLLKTHTERRFADLAAVFAVAWSCISDRHNLLISYALVHQISLGFALLSLYHFGNRFRRRDARETVKSCVFLLLSVMIYEAFAAILLVMAVWALCRRSKKPVSGLTWLRRAGKRILPHLCTVGGYCIVYFVWQKLHPPLYDGIVFNLHEPVLSFSALLGYATGNFPLRELASLAKQTPLSFTDLLGTLRPMAWLTAILAAALFCTALPRLRMREEMLHNLLVISGTGTLACCLLTACSEKYLAWYREGTRAYLSSAYSFVFLVVFLTALAVRLYRAAPEGNRRNTVRGILTAAVLCICLSASAVNAIWKPHFEALLLRYRNFDYAVSMLLPAPEGTWQLYAPDNRGIHENQMYSEDYLRLYDPAGVAYISDAEALSAAAQTLCIRSDADYRCTVSGEADGALRAQTLTFRSVTGAAFDVTLYDTDGEAVYYENVQNGNVLTLPEGKWFDLTVRVETEESQE